MSILDAILNSQNGDAVRQLGASAGLGEAQTSAALQALLPALTAGLQRNTQTPDGMSALLGALASGRHQQYLDNPSALGTPGALTDGNGILGHLLGSKDVSRQLAGQAAAQTGISPDVLKRLLPLVATMVMGALAQQRGRTNGAAAPADGLTGMLGSMLDQNRDGSVVDDVASMFGKFLGR